MPVTFGPKDYDQIEAEAWADLQLAAPAELKQALGISVRRFGNAVALLANRTEVVGINRVFALGSQAPITPAIVDEVVGWYRENGVRRFLIQWSPHSLPATAPDWFAAKGFRAGRRLGKLTRAADKDFHADRELFVDVVTRRDADLYASVLTTAHGDAPDLSAGHAATVGLPGWRHYLVHDGERPVGGGALFVRGTMAWCGFAATLSEARRRGAQTSLLARRVRDAASLGCVTVVCEAQEDLPDRPCQSFRNMVSSGFELAYYSTLHVLDFTPG